ncbi:hypothetical protein BASA81_007701 [Batrachochytrium salamandrivorans]|nr:hypothetical protein BASA81_007701 [Batrachochytrium salamandrivorans]
MPQVYDSHHDAHIDDSDEKWIQFKTRYPIDRLNDYSDLDQIQFEISSGDSTYDEIENRNIPTHSDLDHSKPILVHTGSSRRVDDDVFVQSESKSLDAPLLGLENGDLASQSANHDLGLEENQDKDCTKEDSNAIEDELESGSPIEDDEEQDEEEGSDNDDLGSDAAEQDQKEMEDQLSDREDARLNTTEKSDVSTQAIQSASFEPDDILEPTQNDLLDADGMGDEEDGTDVDRNDEADDTLHKGQGNGCRRCQ